MTAEINTKLEKLFLAYIVAIFLLTVMYIGDSNVLNNTFIVSFRADHILHVLVFIPWAFFCIRLKKTYFHGLYGGYFMLSALKVFSI